MVNKPIHDNNQSKKLNLELVQWENLYSEFKSKRCILCRRESNNMYFCASNCNCSICSQSCFVAYYCNIIKKYSVEANDNKICFLSCYCRKKILISDLKKIDKLSIEGLESLEFNITNYISHNQKYLHSNCSVCLARVVLENGINEKNVSLLVNNSIMSLNHKICTNCYNESIDFSKIKCKICVQDHIFSS